MIRRIGLALLLALMLAPLQVKAAPPPLRAAQVGYLPCRNHAEVAQEFARMRRQGIDTVIIRAFHRPHDRYYAFVEPRAKAGVYFPTKAAPVVADAFGPLVTQARAAGLRVFAWMTTLTTPLEEAPKWSGRRYDLDNGGIVPVNALDPFRPEVRQRLKDLFLDLSRYPIDGILLQDDLVLRHTEGFSAAAMGAYLREYGRLPDPAAFYPERFQAPGGPMRVRRYGAEFWEWSRWRGRHLYRLGMELREVARQQNPEITVAFNMPYEVLTKPDMGLAWFALDFQSAAQAGFDYLSVMAYHRQIAKEMGIPVSQALEMVAQMTAKGRQKLTTAAPLLIKLQTLDFDDHQPLKGTELQQAARSALETAPVSLAFFPYLTAPAALPALPEISKEENR